MVTFNGTDLADTIIGTNFVDLILGKAGNDLLRGQGGNDSIRAGFGDDILEGGAGNDLLFAESGSDSLFGGSESDILVSGFGPDRMNGGSGIDAASWQDAASRVVASLATGRATSAWVEDTFTQVENLIGSRFNDSLFGNQSANELFGGAGNDLLSGGGGSDKLLGGSGGDTLDGGAGSNALRGESGVDTVEFSGATFVDVDLSRGSSFSSLGQSNLNGIENVRATNGSDFILGDTFANRIEGLGGADRMDGGEGDDVLIGGSGADTFVFEAIDLQHFGTPGYDSGEDVIVDFATSDRIDLTRHFEATTFANLKAGASQLADDTVLRLGEDTIRIQDFALRELAVEMFLF